MNSVNKNVVIVVVVVLLVLAIFSYKRSVMDAGNADAAKAEINRQLQNAPTAGDAQPPSTMPSTAGLHQPGNKGH